jgi:hypothetical protein
MRSSRVGVALALAGSIIVMHVPGQGLAQSVPLSAKAKAQIDSVRESVAQFADPRVAEDSGYQPVFGLVPLQGVHYVRPDLIKNGTFSLTRPSVLMYAPVNGTPTLVGVAYAYEHPRSQPIPEGFDGPSDDWHAHDELSRDPNEHIVMVHLWLTDAPGGPFARYNPYLPYMAASLKRPSVKELTANTPRGERARRFAFALAIATHPPQLFDVIESRGGEALMKAAYPHRRALMMAVDSLELAEKRGDRATYDRLVTQTIAHSDALMAAYRGTVRSPRARELIDKTLDELMGVGHEGHEMMPGTMGGGMREAGGGRKSAPFPHPTSHLPPPAGE